MSLLEQGSLVGQTGSAFGWPHTSLPACTPPPWRRVGEGAPNQYKHEVLTQCWCNTGPPSTTLAQYHINIGPMTPVWWAGYTNNPHPLNFQTDDFPFHYSHPDSHIRERGRVLTTLNNLCIDHGDQRLFFSIWNHHRCLLSKHEASAQCCSNVGPPSSTLAQH